MNTKNNLVCLWMGIVLLLPLPAFASKSTKSPKPKGEIILKKDWVQNLKTGSSKKRYFPEQAAPLYQDGKIYVGTHSSFFYALDANQRGKILWTFKSDGPIASQGISNGEAVFFGNNKGTLYALNAANGQKIWETFLGGELLNQPCLVLNTLYVVTTGRRVHALSIQSGEERWQTDVRGYDPAMSMRGVATPVYDRGTLYLGFADGQIAALSAHSGSVLWNKNFAEGPSLFKDVDAAVLLEDSYLYAVGYFGFLVKLGKTTGNVIWKKEVKSGVDITLDAKTVTVATSDSKVIAYDKFTGTRRWEQWLAGGALSAPLKIGKGFLVGGEYNKAYVLDENSGTPIQFVSVPHGFRSNAVLGNASVYFLSATGKLWGMKIVGATLK